MAEFEVYDVGEPVPLRAAFTDAAGEPADPTTVTVLVRAPDGTVTTKVHGDDPEVENPGPGVYTYAHVVDAPGIWRWRWVGTGPAGDVDEGRFTVALSMFAADVGLSPRALCTLDDVIVYDDPTDIGDEGKDELYVRLINAASDELHRVARREFVARNATRDETGQVLVEPETRTFDLRTLWDSGGTDLPIGDLARLDEVTAGGTALAAETVVALPRSRDEWEPITHLRLDRLAPRWDAWAWGPATTVTVTGVWGFPQVPESIRQRTIETVKFWADRDLATFNEVFSVETGQLSIPHSLPRPALETARRFRRGGGIATLRVF